MNIDLKPNMYFTIGYIVGVISAILIFKQKQMTITKKLEYMEKARIALVDMIFDSMIKTELPPILWKEEILEKDKERFETAMKLVESCKVRGNVKL